MSKLNDRLAISEHEQQVALFRAAETYKGRYPELEWLYAIPNGTRTSPHVAVKMKAEGVKKGVPDTCLPVARGGFIGAWVEMKTVYASGKKGQLSQEQKKWMAGLRKLGHYVTVAWDWQDAIQIYLDYLDGKIQREAE